jgi:hypothetical protein
MNIAVALNILWILWVIYIAFTGMGAYTGIHRHAYAYLFFIGMFSIIAGSLWLKYYYFGNRISRWVRLGFGLWIFGAIMYVLSTLAGSRIPAAHMLKEHIIFNHTRFMIFLLGLIISVYADTMIVARLDPRKNAKPAQQ